MEDPNRHEDRKTEVVSTLRSIRRRIMISRVDESIVTLLRRVLEAGKKGAAGTGAPGHGIVSLAGKESEPKMW